ncbi:maleylpyruvate isomerase family mycothiol-dependent enzyme [Streptomyces sp. NPDC057702]|uniref:maleylpyruvate isomerase family mycothiol-dependent enzyme n=1 Tax=unclassified Streptomyces TaxID=2593676 RepID=UPI0036C47AE6
MSELGYDRYRAALARQTDLLRAAVAGADPAARVPTCPEWTVTDLLTHVGQAHRWAEFLLTSRATAYAEDERPASKGPSDGDPAAMDAWLAEGAAMLDAALAAAGPGAPLWSWGQEQSSSFWARRITHETAIHRADAVAVTGAEYAVDPDVAADAIDEWLEIVSNPFAAHFNPSLAELRGTGQAIRLRATDTEPEQAAHWTIELTPDGVRWARAQGAAAVTATGALTDLLLLFYRRLPPSSDRVTVTGDRALLEFWLDRASFR